MITPLYIGELELLHFRNHASLHLHLGPGINCFVGPNGAGKTNLLDALHYLAFARGFRASADQEAVQEGASFFMNTGVLHRDGQAVRVACNYVRGRGKKMLIDGQPLPRLSEHIGSIPLVSILPADTELINGPSAGRRRFLDMLIAQYDRAYLRHLIQYERLLAQRNAQLRLFGEQRFFDRELLLLWDRQLVPHAQGIQQGRADFLVRFQPIFEAYFHEIVSQQETPLLRYRPAVEDNVPEAWEALWRSHEARDLASQYTTAGAHRDDLGFKINGRAVRNYGSQGQQKTFVIALKLAQYRLLGDSTGLHPVLLLDDIFDRLDQHRLERIARLLQSQLQGQVFITDTSAQRLRAIFATGAPRALRFFEVMQGQVQPAGETDDAGTA
ncbi:MAG: DNA replication and repair protein RecF [Bacteroidia bacterium]